MAVIKATDSEFRDYLNQHEKVIVKFFANWCGTCKLFAPKYRRLSDQEDYQEITFLDINAEENPEARQWAGVTNLPYFAVAKNGELIEGDYTGKEETVKEMLEKVKQS